jgi:glycosyltransferase involved in cell wall biosynthesis
MRVLQLCSELPPAPHGGIGSAVADLAPALVARGVDLVIVGVYAPARLPAAQVPETVHGEIHRLASRASSLPFRLRVAAERLQLRQWIAREHRRRPFDLILADDFEGWLPRFRPSRQGTPKLLVRLNGSNFVYDALLGRKGSPPLWSCERRMLRSADAWIGVSRFFLDETAARVAQAGLCEVIPNPVDTSAFSPRRPQEDLAVPGRIVFHNSLGARKGIEDLIDSLPTVFAARADAHLEIYGSAPGFEARRDELLSRLPGELRQRVCFFGRVDRLTALPEALEKAHVACYPSHLETFGIAPVEAMAMKRVTIYSDTGPGREVIDDGRTGLLCPPRDPAALAGTLIRALSLSHSERLAMGEAARAAAVERFDRETVADRYLDLFRRLLDRP